jgi:hypothetical protein
MQTRKLLLYLLLSLVVGFLPATLRADAAPSPLAFTEVSDKKLTVKLNGIDNGQVLPGDLPTESWLWVSDLHVDSSNIPSTPVTYYFNELPGQTTVNSLTLVSENPTAKRFGEMFGFLVQSDVTLPPPGTTIYGNGDGTGPILTFTLGGTPVLTAQISFTFNAESVPDVTSQRMDSLMRSRNLSVFSR